jgi:diaminopimelate decarboxylase
MFPSTLSQTASHPTPFFYYDLTLLKRTLEEIQKQSSLYNYLVHYALKANANDKILSLIQAAGLGADCVSGNEVQKACEHQFHSILFAGVGKTDAEINLSIDKKINCFNCESLQEIEVINSLSKNKNYISKIALRINPNVDAGTHRYITTGLEENKFGINLWELDEVLERIALLSHIQLEGIHFHIGSQISDRNVFQSLCLRINEIQNLFENKKIKLSHVNVGGGLGVDYHHPDLHPMPDFAAYFSVFNQQLEVRKNQKVQFELGRSVVAQCGSLISKVLFVKKGMRTHFVILDAGMTELIRPALYQSHHQIENLSAAITAEKINYDVVGPICESSDCFAKNISLPTTQRGDLIAIRSAGAYGEVMSSNYNLREKAKAVYFSSPIA